MLLDPHWPDDCKANHRTPLGKDLAQVRAWEREYIFFLF